MYGDSGFLSKIEIVIDELVAEVKSTISNSKPNSSYTDEQILKACRQVAEGATEQDLRMLANNQDKWCDRCAGCCTQPPKVEVTTEEVLRIAKYLNMTPSKLMKKYKITPTGKRFEDGPEDKRLVYYHIQAKPCTFLEKGNVCSIYPVRPGACAGFPGLTMISTALRRQGGGQVGGAGGITYPEYCHIIPRWNVHRAIKLLEAEKEKEVL